MAGKTAPKSPSHNAAKPARLAGGNPQIAKADGEDEQLDEAQLAAWVKQARKLPGWGTMGREASVPNGKGTKKRATKNDVQEKKRQ